MPDKFHCSKENFVIDVGSNPAYNSYREDK